MKRFILLLFIVVIIGACSKNKSESDFLWERSFGKGEALFIKPTSDSGFIACGSSDGNPYLARFNKTREIVIDFKADNQGLFSSALYDTSGYYVSGNSGGKILLMRYNTGGNKLWEKTFDAGFRVDYTNLFYSGNGNFLAIGTASADSTSLGITGLYFIRFDKTGLVIVEKKVTETSFVAANRALVDNDGNIILALTRKTGSTKPRASVAKYNNQFAKLWETDLYNNPGFGAASLAIKSDISGNIYVAGKTEVSTSTGKLNSSFIASLTGSGVIRWKKYLEDTNIGSAIIFDNSGNLMILNKNCFILNILSSEDGISAGRIQMFSLCISSSTDAFGEDIGINFDKNLLVAGKRGGNFYLALKAYQ